MTIGIPLPPGEDVAKRSVAKAKVLRRTSTPAEARLWRLLRDRRLAAYKFRRQQAIGPYVVDFYCHELQLAIEFDGSGHTEELQTDHDAVRADYLRHNGVHVLRFWNDDVTDRVDAVVNEIIRLADQHRQ